MTIREVITKEIQKQKDAPLPLDMTLFTINMTGIIICVCHDLLEADVGKVFHEGEEIGGQERDALNIPDIIGVINGEDMLRNTILGIQVLKFFTFFLDQEEPGIDEEDVDGSPLLWTDMHYLLQKWNECAAENQKDK